ncbi:MAG: chorismate--pyruvate lyase [Zhongshania marina]|jgi:chorismate--pyruvate lyase|uniref:Probable chorismate pyruvate-lyase n=1 Tax=Zhongshania marina TaxID=2304603 RepID=A0A2S4HKU0_9GAMM|nr:chorismate lyase [Marortus luteolus]
MVWQRLCSVTFNTGSRVLYAFQTSRFHKQEPNWLDCKKFPRSALPAKDARWLLDTGSLTAHLRRVSQGQFHVEVLFQRWQIPRLSERRLLGMGDRDWGLIREVRLHCHNEPWVYARSVLPATSLVGRLDRLRTLDNRPLGHLLFTDPHMSRDRYEICRVPAMAVGAPESEQNDGLWGRRSRFLLSGHPIMVSEIFLPAFRPW